MLKLHTSHSRLIFYVQRSYLLPARSLIFYGKGSGMQSTKRFEVIFQARIQRGCTRRAPPYFRKGEDFENINHQLNKILISKFTFKMQRSHYVLSIKKNSLSVPIISVWTVAVQRHCSVAQQTVYLTGSITTKYLTITHNSTYYAVVSNVFQSKVCTAPLHCLQCRAL